MRLIKVSGLLILIVLLAAGLSGCGGSGASTPPTLPTVLQPTVSVVTGADAGAQITSTTDTTVVMRPGAPTHAVGDVLVSDAGTAGLLRKVTGVTSNPDGTTTLQTEQAALTDVFQSVEIHQQYTITQADVRSFTPRTRGVRLHVRTPASRVDSGLFTTGMQLDLPIYGALNLNGTISLGLRLNFDLVIKQGALQAFQLAITAEASTALALQAKGDVKKPLSHMEQDLAAFQFATITIWVPSPVGIPIPIIFNFNMVPYVYDDSAFTTTGILTLVKLETKLTAQAGVRVDQNLSVSPVTSATVTPPTLTGLLPDLAKSDPNNSVSMKPLVDLVRNTNWEFKITNTLGLGARFECQLYGMAGPYLKLGMLEHESSAALNLSAVTPSVVFDDRLRCRPVLSGGVKLQILNRQLLDVSINPITSPYSFTINLPFFPATIPLTGAVEATAN